MTAPNLPPGAIALDEVVPPGRPWGRRVAKGDMLRLIDLEGQQAVDFLCYYAKDPSDRYCATNTIKVQGKLFVGKDTVLSRQSAVHGHRRYLRPARHDLWLLQRAQQFPALRCP